MQPPAQEPLDFAPASPPEPVRQQTLEDLQRERRRLQLRLEAQSKIYMETIARVREAEKYAEDTYEKHVKYADAMAKRESNFLKDSMATEKALEAKIMERDAKVAELENHMTCIICMDSQRNVVPACGHLTMCRDCAQANNPKKCPLCRKTYRVDTIRKIYFS